ncbi:MAG: YlbF family regulator [Phycisphaerae bacterium]
MDEILDLAGRLGKRLRDDERVRTMRDAGAALDASAVDRQLLKDYEDQQQKIHDLETAGKPVEPADKRRLADLHAQVASSAVIKAALKAQADYAALMNTVSQRIEQEVLGRTADERRR